MTQDTTLSGFSKRPKHLVRRLALVLLAIIILIIFALLTNAFILARQTKAARLIVPGAELIHTSQGTLQVLDQGDRNAPPIVLIHGVASSLHWWDKITPLLTVHHRVIRMDLLGDGGSEDPPSGHYTVEDQAIAIGEMLKQLRITNATIIGHSLGGAIATSLAEQYPDEVARLVILDTSVDARNVSLGRVSGLTLKPIIGPALKLYIDLSPASAISHATSVGFAPGFSIASGFDNPNQAGLDLQEMTYTSLIENQYSFGAFTSAEPMQTRLTRIGKPLLVIFGAEDQIAIKEANDLSDYRTVPKAHVIVLPGVGHSPQVELPAKTAALILSFIRMS